MTKNPLQVFLKFIEEVRSTKNIDEVIELFIALSEKIFPYHGCGLYLLNEEHNSFEQKKSVTFSDKIEKEIQLMLEEGIIDWIVEERGSRIIPAALFQKDEISSDETNSTERESKYIVTPLLVGKRIIGVFIILIHLSENDVSPAQLDNLFLLANQTASAIENSLLYKDMQKKIKELEVLSETGRALNQVMNKGYLQQVILSMMNDVIEVEWSILFVIDTNGYLVPQASQGVSLQSLSKIKFPVAYGITGLVAKEKQPLIVQEYASDIRFKNNKELLPQGVVIRNAISTPLVAAGSHIIGVLTLYNSKGCEFTDDNFRMVTALASYAGIAIERSSLYEEMQSGYLETIAALANAIEAKDPYTKGHTIRVTKYALEIAYAMNLSPKEIEIIRFAGILHDIGKIGVPESILLKPARLSDEEYKIIQTHSILGEEIIKSVSFLKDAAPVIRHHHESLNGKGYPDQLKGEEIPITARILTVADAFDAMTTDRPYRAAMSLEDALDELQKYSLSQFDFLVVSSLVGILRRKQLLEKNADLTIADILSQGTTRNVDSLASAIPPRPNS